MSYMPFFMWLLPLSFFAYQFILRLWPSLMMQEIMQQFAIDATAFGLLASVYYYGYAGMQLPVAILLDRYGARMVLAASAALCALATCIFTATDSWYLSLASRFLVGAGSAAGFLATSKVVSQWFAKCHYSRMIGFSFTVGLLGAIYGGKPVSLLVASLGGQNVAYTLAAVALTIALLAFLFLRDPVVVDGGQEVSSLQLKDFRNLLAKPSIWFLAIANLLMVGSLEGFADVWGVNFLMTACSLSKAEAAELVSCIFVGMLFGGPALALLSKRFGNLAVIAACGVAMMAAFCAILAFCNYFPWMGLALLFFFVGLVCCYQVLVFSAGSELCSSQLLGVTVAFLNCVNMLGGSFFHSLIGYSMDLFWTGSTQEGVRTYSIDAYQHALLVIPACALLGAGIIMLLALSFRQRKLKLLG